MTGNRTRAVAAVIGRLLAEEARHATRSALGGEDGDPQRQRARRLRIALEELGPFFVKLGQILSTRPDLVSTATTTEFERLHDTVRVAPFADFEAVLVQELGPRWRRRFRRIDVDEPLGTASLAQVYRVVLDDGRDAVVKIQRPGVREVIKSDMSLARRVARTIGKTAPRFNAVIDLEAMLEVIFDAVRSELDFTLEARNMEQAAGHVRGFATLAVPDVILATPRVLIQSMAAGRSIRVARPQDFPAQERQDIARDLLAFMYQGYFIKRTFHADPHPGNILLAPGHPATLIDWGMVGRIDRRVSTALLLILLSLVQNDGFGVAKAWTEMGQHTPWADPSGFGSDMTLLVPKISGADLEHLNFGTALASILKHSTRRGIQTNPMIPILAKSFANMEGSIRYLCPELSLTDVFGDELLGIMFNLAHETLAEPSAARLAVNLMLGAGAGPQDLRRVMQDLSNRELTVQVAQITGKPPSLTAQRHRLLSAAACVVLAAGLRIRLTRSEPTGSQPTGAGR